MKQYKAILALTALLAFPAISSASIVLDDFESGLQGWSASGNATVELGINPLSGSQCMVITPTETGFQWAARRDWPAFDPAEGEITLEVSWVASEWAGLSWLQQNLTAFNSDSGWSQAAPADPTNPSFPGSWDPVNWGDHTRTLTYDFTSYELMGSAWQQLYLSVNVDGAYTGALGSFYIDNIVQVPEPATIGLFGIVGFGTVVFRRRFKI